MTHVSDWKTVVVKTTEELDALEPEWLALFQRCPEAPPFLHPAWQRTWWSVFGAAPLRSIAIRQGGLLVAFAACFEYDDRLVFLGNGISDQAGILAHIAAAADRLIEELQKHRLDLQEITGNSPLLRLPHEPCSISPAIDLQEGAVPRNMRRNLRNARKALEAMGTVRIATTACPDFLPDLFRLHAARWEASGESGVLAEANIRAFHDAVTVPLADAGLLRMHAVLLNEVVIGVVYAYARNRTVYSYLGGFDPSYAEASPGGLAIEAAVDHAIAAGDHWFDFLRGAERYKYAWGAMDRTQYKIFT